METTENSTTNTYITQVGRKPVSDVSALVWVAVGGAILIGIVAVVTVYHAWKRRKTLKISKICRGARTPSAVLKMNHPLPFIIPSLSNPEFAKDFDVGRLKSKRRSIQPIRFPLEDMRPEDYQPCNDKPTVTPSKYGLGKICFSVFYDEESEQMTFSLIRAVHLPAKNIRGTADPYVKISLLPDKPSKLFTKVHRKTLNPIFNENFVFNFPRSTLKSRAVRLVVYDFDRFSRPTAIGHVTVPLGDIDFKPPRCGAEHIWKDVRENIPTEFKRGEILISLTYLPNAERLTVVLLKARDLNLPKTTKAEFEDIRFWVKLTMVTAGRLIKTKRTATIRNDTHPEFNESFSMDLSHTNTGRTCIVTSMQYQSGAFAYPKVLGRVVVGPDRYSTGDGLAHWNDMMAAPRSAVAQWHVLV